MDTPIETKKRGRPVKYEGSVGERHKLAQKIYYQKIRELRELVKNIDPVELERIKMMTKSV